MFNTVAYSTVDMVQGAKKQFVSTFVNHKELSDTFNNFIDAQTEYTKKAIGAGLDAFTSMGSIFANKEFYTQMFDPMKVVSKKAK